MDAVWVCSRPSDCRGGGAGLLFCGDLDRDGDGEWRKAALVLCLDRYSWERMVARLLISAAVVVVGGCGGSTAFSVVLVGCVGTLPCIAAGAVLVGFCCAVFCVGMHSGAD